MTSDAHLDESIATKAATALRGKFSDTAVSIPVTLL